MEVRTVHRPQKTSRDGSSQTNRLETEKYAKACSPDLNEIGRQDGIDVIIFSERVKKSKPIKVRRELTE
jgi:hypothetical protein